MSLLSGLLLSLGAGGLASRAASPAAAEAEGNPWWLWIVVLFILAAFAAFMLWWWLRSPEEEEGLPGPPARSEPPVPVASPEAEVLPEIAATPEPKPEIEREPAITETEELRVDDLQIVEGIGLKIAGVLRDAGVTTFAQLAAMDPDRVKQILRDRDPRLLRLADPGTWPEQARLAAGGEWEALARLQQELRGGRRA